MRAKPPGQSIHVTKGDQDHGPFTLNELVEQMRKKQFAPTDMAWHEGVDKWMAIRELPEWTIIQEEMELPRKAEPSPTLLSQLLSDVGTLAGDKKNRKKYLTIGALSLAGLIIVALWWKLIVAVFLWLVIVPCLLIGLFTAYSALRGKRGKYRRNLLTVSAASFAVALVSWFLIPEDPLGNQTAAAQEVDFSQSTNEDSKSAIDSLTSLLSWKEPARERLSPAEIAQEIKDATVFITHSNATGSGFFILPNVVATNFHVIDPLKTSDIVKLTVVLRSGTNREKAYPARVMTYDVANDLALLHVEADNQPSPVTLGDSDKLIETQKLKVYGFPLNYQLSFSGGNPAITITSGTITSLRKGSDGQLFRVQIDAMMYGGNSGGPTCNESGDLIGVSVSGITKAAGTNFIVPVNRLKALLRTIPNLKAWGQKGAFWFWECAEIADRNLGSRELAIAMLKRGMPRYPNSHKIISEYAGLSELTDSNEGRTLLTPQLQGKYAWDLFMDDLYVVNASLFTLTNIRTKLGNKYVHIHRLDSGIRYKVEDGHYEIVKRGRWTYFDSDQGRGSFNY